MSDFATQKAEEHRRMLCEAAEFGERFPDETDETVIDFIREMFKKPQLHTESFVGRAIIMAYEGDIDAGLHFLRISATDLANTRKTSYMQ